MFPLYGSKSTVINLLSLIPFYKHHSSIKTKKLQDEEKYRPKIDRKIADGLAEQNMKERKKKRSINEISQSNNINITLLIDLENMQKQHIVLKEKLVEFQDRRDKSSQQVKELEKELNEKIIQLQSAESMKGQGFNMATDSPFGMQITTHKFSTRKAGEENKEITKGGQKTLFDELGGDKYELQALYVLLCNYYELG